MDNTNLINATDAAKMLGVTRESFLKGVKSGRYSVAGRGKFDVPLFNISVVTQEYADTKDAAELQDHARMLPQSMRGGRPPKNSKTNDITAQQLLQVKMAKDATQAKMMDLKYKVQSGEYVEKSEVSRMGIELGDMIMGSLQAWPPRLAPELVAMKEADEHDFRILIEREINELIINIRRKCGYER